jgi:hypothetical protein
MTNPRELLEKVQRLKLILIEQATGGLADTSDYAKLREELLAEPSLKGKLPGFLKFCTNLGEFWSHIKEKFGRYQPRRDYLRAEFLPAITMLEAGTVAPSDPTISAALCKVDSEHVREAWQKALERRDSDPEGPSPPPERSSRLYASTFWTKPQRRIRTTGNYRNSTQKRRSN